LLVGNGEFHDGGSTHVHTSERARRYLHVRESVGRSVPVPSYHVGFCSRAAGPFARSEGPLVPRILSGLLAPFATLRSLLEAGGSTLNYAEAVAPDGGRTGDVRDRENASKHYCRRTNYRVQTLKTTALVDTESHAILDVHCTTEKTHDTQLGWRQRLRLDRFTRKTPRRRCETIDKAS